MLLPIVPPSLSLSMCQEKHPVCLSLSLSLAGMFPFILDFQIVIGSSERNRRKAPSFPLALARSLDYDDGGPRGAARARGCKRLKESGSNGDAYHAKANGYLPAGAPTLRQR